MPTTSLLAFITWLATASGTAAAVSFIAERWPAFQQLEPRDKSIFMLVASALIAVISYGVMTYVPSEMLAQLEPVFKLIAGVVGAWMANQFAHAADPHKA